MSVLTLLLASVSAYISTCVICSSSLFEPVRDCIKQHTKFLQIRNNKHPIECRLCLGFWLSLIFSLYYFSSVTYTLPIYGISYFLCTQER